MIEWSLDAFGACGAVAAIVVAVPQEIAGGPSSTASSRLPDIRQIGPGDGSTRVVAGGATRAESVANALAEVETELVAIHDAARPLVTSDLIEALIAALTANPEAAGVIPAAPITDTVKRAKRHLTRSERANCRLDVESTLDRAGLWGAQTPQVFWTQGLREALEVDCEARDSATDESMLLERAGERVLIHRSGPENLKVTTPLDLKVAELLLTERLGPNPPD